MRDGMSSACVEGVKDRKQIYIELDAFGGKCSSFTANLLNYSLQTIQRAWKFSTLDKAQMIRGMHAAHRTLKRCSSLHRQ